MHIAIFGTGGAGGYFGALLAKAGHQVIFIARGEHLNAIRTNGLTVETTRGDVLVNPARATDDPSEIGVVDLILVGVKAWQVKEAAQAMGSMLGTETLVLPLQNGVEAAPELAAELGGPSVLGGLCSTFSWITAPGRIKNIGIANFIKFGERDGSRSERTEILKRMFELAGISADIPDDINQAIWMKFLAVTAFGGVGALTRAPIGVQRSTPETRRLLEHCIVEAYNLSKAMEIGLPVSAATATMAFLDGLPPTATTSLQRDIADGKPSELEYWNGAVKRLAEYADVPAPTHGLIYNFLLPLELRSRGNLFF